MRTYFRFSVSALLVFVSVAIIWSCSERDNHKITNTKKSDDVSEALSANALAFDLYTIGAIDGNGTFWEASEGDVVGYWSSLVNIPSSSFSQFTVESIGNTDPVLFLVAITDNGDKVSGLLTKTTLPDGGVVYLLSGDVCTCSGCSVGCNPKWAKNIETGDTECYCTLCTDNCTKSVTSTAPGNGLANYLTLTAG